MDNLNHVDEMGKFNACRWERNFAGPTRKDRSGGTYWAHVTVELFKHSCCLDGEVAADIADAEKAVLQFNQISMALGHTKALAQLLLRSESVASSRIEGL